MLCPCGKAQGNAFDEPMVGLDPKAIKELKDVIQELSRDGVTILISTHMLEMVRIYGRLCCYG